MSNTNNVQETLISNLIALRKSRGLTQIDLGEKINYSDKTISKWEKGDSCPNVEAVYKIAKFYGVSVDDLLSQDFRADSGAAAEKQRNYSKLIISLLAIMAVWVIATIVFVSLSLMSFRKTWLIFILATPCSAIVALVFNSMWGNTRLNYPIISVLLWTTLTTVFLSSLEYISVFWVVFLVGIPIQIAIVLWSQLKNQRNRARKKARDKTSQPTETPNDSPS
jgi:transcriptional regulator with XRE-family HTH domain